MKLKLRSPETIPMFSFLRLCRLGVDDLIGYLEIFDLYDPRVDFNVKNRSEQSLLYLNKYCSTFWHHRYKHNEENLEISISILMHK